MHVFYPLTLVPTCNPLSALQSYKLSIFKLFTTEVQVDFFSTCAKVQQCTQNHRRTIEHTYI